MLAPIAIFAFNRPQHLKKTLDALAANSLAEESDVVIFCDGPRNAEEAALTDSVCTVAREASGFHSVRTVERERNLGCAQAVISGLAEMFALHERVVIIEDDVLTSPYTLRYLNKALEQYACLRTVFSISAWAPPRKVFAMAEEYPYDAYFTPRTNIWGWATWRDRWQSVDWLHDYQAFARNTVLRKAFDQGGDDLSQTLDAQMRGDINAWGIRLEYARFRQGGLGLNPIFSFTTNIGMGSGTHTVIEDHRWDNDISLALPEVRLPDHVFVDAATRLKLQKVYRLTPLWVRAINKAARIVMKHNIIQNY